MDFKQTCKQLNYLLKQRPTLSKKKTPLKIQTHQDNIMSIIQSKIIRHDKKEKKRPITRKNKSSLQKEIQNASDYTTDYTTEL